MTLKQAIEALVFASQKPISPKEIAAAFRAAGTESEIAEAQDFAKIKEEEVTSLLQELEKESQEGDRAFYLMEKVNGWHFVTNPSYSPWVRQLFPEAKPTRLSGPALETLAIIAYRQPITRADIEAVRGVAVDGMVQALLERGLVRIAGRAELPGRPLLYETTQYFLEHFGLKKLDDLPNTSELRKVNLPKAEIPTADTPEAPEKATAKRKKKGGESAANPAPSAAAEPAEPAPAPEAPPPTSSEPSEQADASTASEPVESAEPAVPQETQVESTLPPEVAPGQPEPPIQDEIT